MVSQDYGSDDNESYQKERILAKRCYYVVIASALIIAGFLVSREILDNSKLEKMTKIGNAPLNITPSKKLFD